MKQLPKLGFRQLPDIRDERYPLSLLMKAMVEIPVVKAWRPGPVTDQKQESSCVGQACWQLLASEPVISPLMADLTPWGIYTEARLNDEFSDNDNSDTGTSVRAGLETLKRHGAISAYYWSSDAQECLDYMLRFGPLVFGTRWDNEMFETDSDGYVYPTGNAAGGHAYLACVASWQDKAITFQNSWGKSFGKDGQFNMTLSAIDSLLKDGGCAAACTEPQPVLA